MRTLRSASSVSVLLVASLLFSQNCATLISGTKQQVPITSNPSGAKISVDGKETGYTPMVLTLKKKGNHLIRIEKEGYDPLEVTVKRKISSSLAISIPGSVLLGLVASLPGAVMVGEGMFGGIFGGIFGQDTREAEEAMETGTLLATIGLVLGCAIGLFVDFSSGANYKLTPETLELILTSSGDKAQTRFIILDQDKILRTKWIRIRCSSGKQ